MGQAQPSPSPKEFLKRNMALSRGTLEGQKSDEDFKGEVSAKKFSPAIIAWKKRNLLENFRNILFMFYLDMAKGDGRCWVYKSVVLGTPQIYSISFF